MLNEAAHPKLLDQTREPPKGGEVVEGESDWRSNFPRCANCKEYGPDVRSLPQGARSSATGSNGGLCMCPCERVYYCNPQCQAQHWSAHKEHCEHGRVSRIPATVCANCGVLSSTNMWCVCGTVLYCTLECQRAHWEKEHCEQCQPIGTTSRRGLAIVRDAIAAMSEKKMVPLLRKKVSLRR